MTTTTDLIREADQAQSNYDQLRRVNRHAPITEHARVEAANAYLRLANKLGVTIHDARRVLREHREARLMLGTRP